MVKKSAQSQLEKKVANLVKKQEKKEQAKKEKKEEKEQAQEEEALQAVSAEAQPKKPVAAYWIYVEEHREAIVKEIGTSKVSAVAKKSGEQWKALSAVDRKPFEDRAAEKKAKYDEAVESFKAGGGVMKKRLKVHKFNKFRKNPDAPKIPVGGGYAVFKNENRESIKKVSGNAVGDIAKETSERWKALASPEKRVYKEKYAEKKTNYEKELEEFKAAGGEYKVVKDAPPRQSSSLKWNGFKKNGPAKQSRGMKRKAEEDACKAAIDRMRATRCASVGA